MKPFRWNIEKEEQLGRLTVGERSEAYPEFVDDLRTCASRLLSFSEDGRVAFVGRSPESLYDYLSGALGETSKSEDLVLVNISNRDEPMVDIKNKWPSAFLALKTHFADCGIAPQAILSRKQKTWFADLVASGGTFGQIASFLFLWAQEESLSLNDLRLKLGFVGITWRTKTSPNTWRWFQHSEWVDQFRIRNIKSLSVPGRLWTYLGNEQKKVSCTNPPDCWDSGSMLEPPREDSHLEALRRALDLYQRGQGERHLFAEMLGRETAIRESWLRRLLAELRKVASN